jgi:hypothetical protein
MKKLLLIFIAVLLLVTAVNCIDREGTLDEICFKEEKDVDMCYDDSEWHYNYWLKRKRDLHRNTTVIGN